MFLGEEVSVSVGLFDGMRDRGERRRRGKAQERADEAMRAWHAKADRLDRLIAEARSFSGEAAESVAGITLKKGERVFLANEPVRLVLDDQRPVDQGQLTITSRRAVFHGGKHLREWPFANLISFQHHPGNALTTMYVSVRYVVVNKQHLSGFMVAKPENTARTRFRFDLALASHRKTLPRLISRLEEDRDEHERVKPAQPAMPAVTWLDGAAVETKQKLFGQQFDQFVDRVSAVAASLRDVTSAREEALVEAFWLVSSFIDADDVLSADEIGPLCDVMESRAGLSADFGMIENGAAWRSRPSDLFDAIVVADSRQRTTHAQTYLDEALALARVVCEFDGDIPAAELRALEEFETLLRSRIAAGSKNTRRQRR